MKRTLKIATFTLLLLVVVFVALIIDISPTVERQAHEQVENAEDVNSLISQLRGGLKQRYSTQRIDITLNQAESLIGFAQRALPNLAAEINLSDGLASINMSYKLPSYLFGTHLNISVETISSESLVVKSVSVGDISLPGAWALSWAESAANSYTESEIATVAISQVSKVTISSNNINVVVNPIDTFLKELKSIRVSGKDEMDELLRIKTAHYLRLLIDLKAPANLNADTSLSYYLHHLMKEAKYLSQDPEGGQLSSATLENEAAIYALGIYAGHRRFSSLVGDLSFAVGDSTFKQVQPVLAGRKDLSLHFIFSAVIKLMSQQDISNAVGEFKELMDRGEGGSGYSFVDLAADMAGANFAALAVNPHTALQVQNIMSLDANELLFFPAIDELEEGMDKTEFRQKYSNIESDSYKRVVNEIDARIKMLPLGSAP
ncbi:hypothetical protein ISG33_00545 [Glaciecola sp. MH2013]|nr:hypothetical protein [Glaciecola sp. MH2013]